MVSARGFNGLTRIVFGVACFGLVAGCATTIKENAKAFKKDDAHAKKYFASVPKEAKTFEMHHDAWLADRESWFPVKKDLPKAFDMPVSAIITQPSSIYAISEWLTSNTSFPVAVHQGRTLAYGIQVGAKANASAVGSIPQSGSSGAGGAAGGSGAAAPTSGINGQSSAQPQQYGQNAQMTSFGLFSGSAERLITVRYKGPLKGLLDSVAARFGMFWKYDNGQIQFSRYETHVFNVKAPTANTSVSTTISDVGSIGSGAAMQGLSMLSSMPGMSGAGMSTGMSGGSSGGQQTGQTIALSQQSAIWTEVSNALQTILMDKGTYTVSPSTGTVTVTTTPALMAQASSFIHKINRGLRKQIFLEIQLIDVQLTTQDAMDINWASAIKGLAGAAPGLGMLGSTSAGIFGSSTGSGASNPIATGTFTVPASSSTMLMKALSTVGKVMNSTTVHLAILNHQTSPVQVAQSISYLAENMAGAANISSTYTSTIPGQVQVGFTMNVTPHLTHNRSMLLEMSVDDSNLIAMNTFGPTGQQIQLPNVSSRMFMQRIRIRSGEMAVVSGFKQIQNTTTQNGVGTPGNFVLGGGFNASHQREVLVIFAKPVVVD